MSDYEHVNHPKHYNDHPSGVEAIVVCEHMCFNIGIALKHLWRIGKKPGELPERDLNKAKFYLNHEMERLKKIGSQSTPLPWHLQLFVVKVRDADPESKLGKIMDIINDVFGRAINRSDVAKMIAVLEAQ